MDVTLTPLVVEPSLGVDDPAPAQGPADASAAERFSELMDAPERTGPQDAGVVNAAAPTGGPRTLGDQILGGLHHVSGELQQTWQSVGHALHGSAALAVRDMLLVQRDLAMMSVQYELVGKAVSRSTQNIDQLVKLQ
jgi:type III secretion protein I